MTACSSRRAKEGRAAKLAGLARIRVGEQLDLIDRDRFELCWIVRFPFYEYDEDAKKIDSRTIPSPCRRAVSMR